MNKKISELPIMDLGQDGYIPVVETTTGETKRLAVADIFSAVGDVKSSMLTPEQFNEVNFGTWLLMDGQSCVGTAYASLTGNTTVPNAFTDGRFLRQAKTGRVLGSLEQDSFASHTHVQNAHYHHDSTGYVSGGYWGYDAGGVGAVFFNHGDGYTANTNRTQSITATNQNTGGAETAPKNVGVNFFIRVN